MAGCAGDAGTGLMAAGAAGIDVVSTQAPHRHVLRQAGWVASAGAAVRERLMDVRDQLTGPN